MDKAQIRPCLEYGSHLWSGASKHSLATLDAIQKRAIKLIGDTTITNSLDSLAHRRTISALSRYHRYHHGVCSVELKSIIPPKAVFTRNTRFLNAQHPFAVKLNKNRTSAFAKSFIPLTSRDWNSPPATVFPATYNLQLFKTHIHRYLQLLPSPYKIPSSSSFHNGGTNPGLWELHLFGLSPSLINIIKKKYHQVKAPSKSFYVKQLIRNGCLANRGNQISIELFCRELIL